MSIIVFQVLDITEDVLNVTREVGYNSAAIGEILRKRTYELKDSDKYNPEVEGSYFNLNPYRGRQIVERDEQGIITFDGEIETIKTINRARSESVIIEANEPLRLLLDYPVEENTKDETYDVSGAHLKGNDTIQVDIGTVEIEEPTLVSFTSSLIPRYQINEKYPASGATKTIILDRILEKDLADNDTVYITYPKELTVAAALKNAISVVVDPSRIMNGFDTLDTAAGSNKIVLNVKIEDNITLRQHISNLLNLIGGVYQIVTYYNGQIDLVSLPWNGTDIFSFDVTADELVMPIEIVDDNTRLLAGYDCLYRSGDEVLIWSRNVGGYELIYNSTKRFQPIQGGQLNASSYSYLYNSVASAKYHGDLPRFYFRAPKKHIKCNVKKTYSNDLNIGLNLQRGFRCNLTVKQGDKTIYTDEKAIVYSSTYNADQSLWSNVVFELINNPYPGL